MAGAPDPNKWLGLLKWSMKYQDGTAPTEFNEMKEEDKLFLEKVMKECVIDEVERMTQIIKILGGMEPSEVFGTEKQEYDEDELLEYRDQLMEELMDRISQIDNAETFVKIRGLATILDYFNNPRKESRALAVEVFATLVQNNPFCQKAALETNVLEQLVCMLTEDEDENCRVKAMLAISCLVRGNTLAENQLMNPKLGALDSMKKTVVSGSIRLQRKVLFFLRFLVTSTPSNAKNIASLFLDSIVGCIGHEDIEMRESCLELLIQLLESEESRNICKESTQLLNAIQKRNQLLANLKEDNHIEIDLVTRVKNQLEH